MASPDLEAGPVYRKKLDNLSPAFTGLFDRIIELVNENPHFPQDKGHPSTGTRIFLPTRREDSTSTAFIGWESEPQATAIHGLEIAHVNLESIWVPVFPRHRLATAIYRHHLTYDGRVMRRAYGGGLGEHSAPIANGDLSDLAIVALTRRLSVESN